MPQYWAGFVDDKIDTREVDIGFGGWGETLQRLPALFVSKHEAKINYQDVRKVEVRVVSKRKRTRSR